MVGLLWMMFWPRVIESRYREGELVVVVGVEGLKEIS
jgi:hypothetical protein